MTFIEVGLADKTGKISPSLMRAAVRALHTQVTRDLPKYWSIHAAVSWLPDAAEIPAGVWPVFLVDRLPAGEGGTHLDRHNQPYAKVIAKQGNDDWTVDASHELLEMLIDPYGNRLQTGPSLKVVKGKVAEGHSQFAYLVEACDPCQGYAHAYPIHGIAVSDFITPHYYDPVRTPGTRYSFTGKVKHPREVLPGDTCHGLTTGTASGSSCCGWTRRKLRESATTGQHRRRQAFGAGWMRRCAGMRRKICAMLIRLQSTARSSGIARAAAAKPRQSRGFGGSFTSNKVQDCEAG